MKFQSFKNQPGFTLVELLVYIATLAVIIVIVSNFLIFAIKSNNKSQAFQEVTDNGRMAMKAITYEIKEAKSIYIPTSNSAQLSLETTHYLQDGEETSYIDFFLCGTALCLKKESEDPISLTTERIIVNNLEFIQIAASSVQINLGINFKNPLNRPEYQAAIDLTSTASLRIY